VVATFKKPQRLRAVSKIFPGSWGPSRSIAAETYVEKLESAVEGTYFSVGKKPFKRNSKKDWAAILRSAQAARFSEIPEDVYIRYHRGIAILTIAIRNIAVESSTNVFVVRSAKFFYGATATGKSHTAWEEAGADAYSKDPGSRWWCGYRGQKNVIVDEFRGIIAVHHLLRWLDKYPLTVETKGGSVPLVAERFWFCSNLTLRECYSQLDNISYHALERRFEIKEFINKVDC